MNTDSIFICLNIVSLISVSIFIYLQLSKNTTDIYLYDKIKKRINRSSIGSILLSLRLTCFDPIIKVEDIQSIYNLLAVITEIKFNLPVRAHFRVLILEKTIIRFLNVFNEEKFWIKRNGTFLMRKDVLFSHYWGDEIRLTKEEKGIAYKLYIKELSFLLNKTDKDLYLFLLFLIKQRKFGVFY